MDSAVQSNSTTESVAAVAELGEEASALLKPEMHPLDFIAKLMDQQMYADAVRFLAHALPKREAVWWAWMSARRITPENAPAKIKAALEATEKWIAQPSDENRRAAKEAADAASLGTAAGCAGLAAFFAGDSLAPPNLPPVPPGPYLTAKAVAGAVNFAALSGDPRQAPEKFKSFVAQGVEVTRRIKLWEGKG
ncbi:MAG TPA: hypothetical protein VMH81_21225 [Bryobacteraceae bacterium]|nr:hypothetical protein [Bryobacteraceae bacterium]